jgi:hypothetical protein
MMERAGVAAGLKLKVHPHMLRHACGYTLANAGHDTRSLQAYLGHSNIQHTVRYTELAPDRFKHFWESIDLIGTLQNNPTRRHVGRSAHEKPRQLTELTGFYLVAGRGFEPLTFRL